MNTLGPEPLDLRAGDAGDLVQVVVGLPALGAQLAPGAELAVLDSLGIGDVGMPRGKRHGKRQEAIAYLLVVARVIGEAVGVLGLVAEDEVHGPRFASLNLTQQV